MNRDEVMISITLHELDFISLVRASRLVGLPRDEVVRRAIAGYLVNLQRQGLDLGIVLPEEPAKAPPGDGQRASVKPSKEEGGAAPQV